MANSSGIVLSENCMVCYILTKQELQSFEAWLNKTKILKLV